MMLVEHSVLQAAAVVGRDTMAFQPEHLKALLLPSAGLNAFIIGCIQQWN